jgi:hypothetical protein
MKKIKSLVLASALGLGMVNMASAINYVYFTGSTAARASVVAAMTTVGVVFDSISSQVGQGNATFNKCTYHIITGHLIGDTVGVVTSIKTDWSGSEGGIADLVGGTEQFLDDTATSSSTSTGPFVSSPVDLAMADNDKAFSKNPAAAITGAFVGIIPFKWVKEKGSLAGITGITDQQIRILLTGGSKAALLTGNSADTTWVYVTGRDSFSGTRVNTLGDCGYGIFSNPSQGKIASDGSMIDVDGTGTYVGYDSGSLYGYASGGSIATQMGYDLSQSTSIDQVQGSGHFSIVAYLGYSDAGSAIANGGTELTYNGVAESTAAIQQGKYNFWGNEYIYKKNTGLSAQASSVWTKLASSTTGINHQADGLSFIDLTTMQATRNGPTSDPIHN